MYRASACRVCGEVFEAVGDVCGPCTAAASREQAEADRLRKEQRRTETKQVIAGEFRSSAVAIALTALLGLVLFVFAYYVLTRPEW